MAHGDEQATTAGKSKAAAARVCGGSRAWRMGHGLGVLGAADGLKSPGTRRWRAGHARGGVLRSDSAAAAESGVETGGAWG
jgi:hypothetical protein